MRAKAKKLIKQQKDGLILAIKVTPNSKKNSIGDIVLDQNNKKVLKIYTSAKPENNKANEAVLKLLSKALHLKKNKINIISGSKQRNKVIHVLGNREELLKNLENCCKTKEA